MLGEDARRPVVGALDDPADLVVDLTRDLIGIVGLGRELPPEERLAVVVAEDPRTELLAHPETHHHLLRRRRDLLDVIRRARRDLPEHDLLSSPTTQRHRHRVQQLRPRRQKTILRRHRDRVTQRLTTTDHADLVHRIGMLQKIPHDRMTHLMKRRDQPLLLTHHPRLLLRTSDHPQNALLQLHLRDLPLPRPRRQQRRLIDQIRQIRTREPRRLTRQRIDIDLLAQRLATRMNLKNLRATLAIRTINRDLTIKTTRPQQRRIENVRTIGRRDHDDVVLRLEPIHLDQQLVERLLTLIVSAAHPRATVTTDGVDLVHEDDARTVLLGLLEQIPHTRGTHTHEHLYEVRPRDREERHTGLAGDRAGQQRLAGARRPVEEDTRRNSRAQAPGTSSGSRGTP